MNQRLYRSRDERIIFGVAGGIANQFNIDPSLIRILWVVLAIATFGAAVLLYVAMAFIVPEEPAGEDRWARWEKAGNGSFQWPDSGAADASTGAPTGSTVAPTGSTGAPNAASPTASTAPSTGLPGSGPSSASFVATPGVTDVDPATRPIGTESIPGATRASARTQRHAARAERHSGGMDGHGAIIAGLVLLLVGGFFLVRTYTPSIDVEQAWPILLVVVGAVLLLGAVRRSPGESA